jgi:hypothetical protein
MDKKVKKVNILLEILVPIAVDGYLILLLVTVPPLPALQDGACHLCQPRLLGLVMSK